MTSNQKKVSLPLSISIVSAIFYSMLLGNLIAVVFIVPFVLSTALLFAWNGERWLKEVDEWAKTDD